MRNYANQPIGTVPRARQLRRNASEPERRLLRALREAVPHLKWHQAPVGPYYADILCWSEKLVIEVDGDTHAAAAGYDDTRTRFMQAQGYRVLRVANPDVTGNLEGVLGQISFSLRDKETTRAAQPCGKDEGDPANEKGSAV